MLASHVLGEMLVSSLAIALTKMHVLGRGTYPQYTYAIALEMIFHENVRNVYGVICTWNTCERRKNNLLLYDLCYKLLIKGLATVFFFF